MADSTVIPVSDIPADRRAGELRVWIDQDLCTGDGICTDHAPSVFTILEDGIAYCLEGDKIFNDPGGSAELAVVPRAAEVDVIDAAAECPGECIFIEFAEHDELEDSSQ
jgi:ferredoxin